MASEVSEVTYRVSMENQYASDGRPTFYEQKKRAGTNTETNTCEAYIFMYAWLRLYIAVYWNQHIHSYRTQVCGEKFNNAQLVHVPIYPLEANGGKDYIGQYSRREHAADHGHGDSWKLVYGLILHISQALKVFCGIFSSSISGIIVLYRSMPIY